MSVNVTRASVLEDGILQFPTRGPRSIPFPNEKDVTYGRNALRGLNQLQTRYDAPIMSESLSSALEYLYEHLPAKVRGLMTWMSPDDMDLFPDHLEIGDTEGYKTFHERCRANSKIKFEPTYKSVRENEYLIHQVDTKDGHYVTVILHLQNDDPHDCRTSSPYTTVDRSVFIDPSTGPAAESRVAHVRARLAEFMRPVLANIDDRAAHEGELWVPPAQRTDEYFSSGLRAYVLFEELTRRLIDLNCAGKTYDPDILWRPTCAWTNLEKARDDMIGAAARQVRRYMDFVPRVTLSLIKGPKIGKQDRRAPVQPRLYTPPEVGRIPKSRFVNDDEDFERSGSGEETDDGSSESESDESDDEDLHQRVDDAFMKLAGGDNASDEKEEAAAAAEEEEAKPASIGAAEDAKTARLIDDAQMGFVGGGVDDEKTKGAEAMMQDAPDAAADDAVQRSRRDSRNGAAQTSVLQIDTGAAEQHNEDETPVFYGPQWPGEIPRPASATARYLANRLDLQAPEASFIVENGAGDALPEEAVSTVEQDSFEMEVESSAVKGEQAEESLLVDPSDDVGIILPDAPLTTSPVAMTHDDRCVFVYYDPLEERNDLPFSRSPPPAIHVGDENDVDEDADEVVNEPFCRSDAPSPEFEVPMASRPPTPAVEKSAKRKLSVVDDYDDDTTNTQSVEEPPAKRQRTESPSTQDNGVVAVEEYNPAHPALGAPTWTWDAANSAGSPIPGLGLTQEQAAPIAMSTVPDTQTPEVEGEAKAEGTEPASPEVPSYIA
ncbi:hypothetical protein PG985_010954 [Apiospora marii]|uniref:Uncharacterized protein n=1 Tax=Apiospora marii TaxID=335849 RepID=A0ABR1SU45_9PEZI